jgi:hypothetical protein
MSRKLMGVIHGNKFYRLPEDAEALEAARSVSRPTSRNATGVYSSKRGLKSKSLGCHRKQAAMLTAEIEKHGIQGVRYVKGRHGYDCEMTSNRGAEQWMKVYGEMHGLGPLHNAGSEGVD